MPFLIEIKRKHLVLSVANVVLGTSAIIDLKKSVPEVSKHLGVGKYIVG